MPLEQILNGKRVEMSPEEEQQLIEQQQATPAPPRRVAKLTIMSRVQAAGKLGDAARGLLANPELLARWARPGADFVDADDPDTAAFLTSLGLDPDIILAPD